MSENKKSELDTRALDYTFMMELLDELCRRYDFFSMNYLGTSLLGKNIPIVKLGDADDAVLYVGSHHAAEWLCGTVLMRFLFDYSTLRSTDKSPFGVRLSEYPKSIYVVPMLNPDGVDMAINGVSEDNILKDRLFSMNKNSRDFSHWKANARGVDLNHNYNAGFEEYKPIEASLGIFGGAPTRYSGEYAESEPEVGALCSFLRFNENVKMVLTLHTQGEEIYYSSGDVVLPKAKEIAAYFSRLCGYAAAVPEGAAAYGGLTDWVIRELGRYSFTLECGRGETPLPLEDGFKIYSDLRELLFSAPLVRV